MKVVKTLERKGVIQLFGVSLILAPFLNVFLALQMIPHVDHLSIKTFWSVLTNGSFTNTLLYISSVLIGLIMLSGSRMAWRAVLLLTGGYMATQVMNFGHNMRESWTTIPFFIVNASVFLFIADQLVWKQAPTLKEESVVTKPVAAAPLAPKPMAALLKALPKPPQTKVKIHFEGFGHWAQLVSISTKELRVRAFAEAPKNIETRMMELQLKNGLLLRIRYSHRTDSDFFFSYVGIQPQETQLLNQWLKRLKAAA